MDHVRKQRGSIVLYKEKRNGADYIRIEYADSEWKIQCKLPPKTKRFCPLVLK